MYPFQGALACMIRIYSTAPLQATVAVGHVEPDVGHLGPLPQVLRLQVQLLTARRPTAHRATPVCPAEAPPLSSAAAKPFLVAAATVMRVFSSSSWMEGRLLSSMFRHPSSTLRVCISKVVFVTRSEAACVLAVALPSDAATRASLHSLPQLLVPVSILRLRM